MSLKLAILCFWFLFAGFVPADISLAVEPIKASASIKATARVEYPIGITSLLSKSDQAIDINAESWTDSRRLLHFPNREGLIVSIDDGEGKTDYYNIDNFDSGKSDIFHPGLSNRTIILNYDRLTTAVSDRPVIVITIIDSGI